MENDIIVVTPLRKSRKVFAGLISQESVEFHSGIGGSSNLGSMSVVELNGKGALFKSVADQRTLDHNAIYH